MKPNQEPSSVLSDAIDHVAFGLVGMSVFLFVVPMTRLRRLSNTSVWDPGAGLRQAFTTLIVGFLIGVAISVCHRVIRQNRAER